MQKVGAQSQSPSRPTYSTAPCRVPQDLATFDLWECNLVAGVPRSVAALLPPNLQTLCLWYEPDAIDRQDLFAVSTQERRRRLPFISVWTPIVCMLSTFTSQQNSNMDLTAGWMPPSGLSANCQCMCIWRMAIYMHVVVSLAGAQWQVCRPRWAGCQSARIPASAADAASVPSPPTWQEHSNVRCRRKHKLCQPCSVSDLQ